MKQSDRTPTARPILIFAFGNPSRGDDGLGPAMYDLLNRDPIQGVELQTDFQLQVEHALDFEGRKFVLFVDAGFECPEPFDLQSLVAEKDDSYTTHSMSPASLLAVYRQIKRCEPPPAFLLTIRGYTFELGEGLSKQARANLLSARDFLASDPPWAILDGSYVEDKPTDQPG